VPAIRKRATSRALLEIILHVPVFGFPALNSAELSGAERPNLPAS
jgi:hypothetical protein